MIRINLLGTQKGKNKRSAASAAAVMEVGDVGSPKMKILVVLALAGLVNLGYWYQLDKQHRDIAAKMEVAVRKNAELADVKARYLERQREGRELQAPGGRDRPAARGSVRSGQSDEYHRTDGEWHRSGVVEQHEGHGSQR